MKSTINLPTRLKQLRKENNYSQEYVAEQLNISRQAISHWENGKAYPDIDNLVLLAELFHMTVDELLDEGGREDKGEVCPDGGDSDDNNDNEDKNHVPDESREKSNIIETLVLSIILVLSSNLPMIGIPVALIIFIWLVYNKRRYKLLYILCVICIIMGICEIHIVYTHLNTSYGNTYLVPK